MAQVSYGTITISDLTDITDVYLQYGLAVSGAIVTNIYTFSQTGEIGWSETYPTWISGYQIWIRQVTEKEEIDTPEYGTPYLDTAVNQINNTIGIINTDLQTRLKYFWDNINNNNYPKGTYMAEGIENITFDYENSSTYGYNTHYANGIKLRYNDINLTTLLHNGLSLYYPIIDNNNIIVNSTKGAEFSANALSFFQPPTISGSTVTQGKKTMELTGSALNFYGSSTSTPDATLTSNGLKLVKGGIEAGESNNSGFIYLSTENYGNYAIQGNEFSDWKEIIGVNFGIREDGSIYASSGLIGGWSIDTDKLYSADKTDVVTASEGAYIGPAGFGISGGDIDNTTYFTATKISIGGLLNWNAPEGGEQSKLNINADDITLGTYIDEKENEHPFEVKALLSETINTNKQQNESINTLNQNVENITSKINKYDLFIEPFIDKNNNSYSYIDFQYKNEQQYNPKIKITTNSINFSLTTDNNIITQISNNLMHTTFGEFENLRMRTGNNGNLTWIARSNGHLSLKAVN